MNMLNKVVAWILIGLGIVALEWIFLSLICSVFNGMSQEGAVAFGVGLFLALEMAVCTGIIVSKINK